MKTVQDAINSFKNHLTVLYEKQEAEAITTLVLNEITGFSKAKLKAFPETNLSTEQSDKLFTLINELKTGKPIQYILSYTEFYGLKFNVNSSVLIPRPETEELVSWILESIAMPFINILDIGTGSGCIAISLKHELPQASVTAIDISTDALETAKQNAVENNTAIDFIEANILNTGNLSLPHKFDVIVSNPPYVTETDKKQMHTNVTEFEPHTALFVPETDPLLFYNAITDFAIKNLNKNGLLFFEINESYGNEIIEMLTDKSFTDIELRKDIRGKNRMIKASYTSN